MCRGVTRKCLSCDFAFAQRNGVLRAPLRVCGFRLFGERLVLMLVREDDEQCTKDPFAGSPEALDSELADAFTGCYGLSIRNLL